MVAVTIVGASKDIAKINRLLLPVDRLAEDRIAIEVHLATPITRHASVASLVLGGWALGRVGGERLGG